MKKLLITAIAAFSISAHAQVSSQDLAVCKMVGGAAKVAMKERQAGTSMVEMLERAGDNRLAITLVTQAYGNPKYSSPEFKRKAVSDFGNKMIESCIKIKMGQ